MNLSELLPGHNAPDLLNLWSLDLETQFMNESRSRNLRIPKDSATNPHWTPHEISLDGVYAIGSSGWDWKNKQSKWVGFDFDALTSHAPGVGINEEELQGVLEAAQKLPYVMSRKSSSGDGVHLYVFLEPVKTENHNEHAAVAKSVLGQMSVDAAFDFFPKVDVCGRILWFHHTKKATPENGGFRLIKEHSELFKVPSNWRDHIDVVTRRRGKVEIKGVRDDELQELTTSHARVPLDAEHNRIIDELNTTGFQSFWLNDHHLLQTHTVALSKVGHKGFFETNSPGSNPMEPNCFAFPLQDGEWAVYRFGNTKEHHAWKHDKWTWCYFNRQTDWETAVRVCGGTVASTAYRFRHFEDCVKALLLVGQNIEIPPGFAKCEAKITPNGEHVKVRAHKDLSPEGNWFFTAGWWEHCIEALPAPSEKIDCVGLDKKARLLATPDRETTNAYLKNDQGDWVGHAVHNIRAVLLSDYGHSEVNHYMAALLRNNWNRVYLPFQPEFPGGRAWNKDSPQLACPPVSEPTPHPTWDMVLNHIGQDLDDELEKLGNGIRTGGEYLKTWIACAFQDPFSPLPYLYLQGDENCGKSTLHEAIQLLLKDGKGLVKADRVFTSEFNGELEGAIFAVIEEADLTSRRAIQRLKDFVTSPTISIRKMRTNAYDSPNLAHWIHTANPADALAIPATDTRICMIHVQRPPTEIAKSELLKQLRAEVPAFLYTVLHTPLPEQQGRLRLEVVSTPSKQDVQGMTASSFQRFIEDECKPCEGNRLLFKDVYERYLDWLPPADKPFALSRQKCGLSMPSHYPKARGTANQTFVGNICFVSDDCVESEPYQLVGGKLKKCKR